MDALETVKVIPFFSTKSVVRSADFYSQILGFETSINPGMVSVYGGPKAVVNIHIFEQPERARGCCMVMLRILDDVDALRSRIIEKGIQHVHGIDNWTGHSVSRSTAAVGPVEDKPWGYRQFDLLDPDGNMLVFFAFISED